MNNCIVMGAQWGDEGKGKIVDLLAAEADRVIRFNGGNNAGHTLVAQGRTWKLNLLPCGLLHGRPGVIGNGVVLDPAALLREIDEVQSQGLDVSPAHLSVSDCAALVLPVHRQVEAAEEARRRHPIGTTLRGIGPALQDKVGRRAVRAGDLRHAGVLRARLEDLLGYHNALLAGWGEPPVDLEETLEFLLALAPRLTPYIRPVAPLLEKACQTGERLLYEGAQAILLDVDHGTYPFVTSSHTAAAQAALGTGFGLATQAMVLGVCKAYTTRVGHGPFPTETPGELGDHLRERGGEYGVNTGRPRRCGWFDAMTVRAGIRAGGIHALALTKLDVLDGLPEVRLATAYRVGDQILTEVPADLANTDDLEPLYETLPGWSLPTAGVRQYTDLPAEARAFIRRIEELTLTPVTIVSTSPNREDTVVRQSPWLS